MTPMLLKKYDEAISMHHYLAQEVILEYRGSFSNLPQNIEILSAMDDHLQVSISLEELPALASLSKIKTIKLPSYQCGVTQRL